MSAPNRWLILMIVSAALLLIVIDMTVLYTALPRLTHDLHATATEKLWIVNAYPLVVAGLLLGAGTLGDRFGHRRLFLAGLVVFGLASLLAAYSPTPAILIGARVLLAVGAAMMMPATLSIIRHTFEDEHERGMAIGIWAAVASGGAALGPLVGGALLEYFWWGSVFLINVPIVILALLLTLYLIPHQPGRPDRTWDLLSSLQIMVGLIGVTYAIKSLAQHSPQYGEVLVSALLGLVFLYLFVRRQKRLPSPLLDFSLFRIARLRHGVATALCASLALIGLELVLSQHLQLVQQRSPLQAGLFILPIPLASFFCSPLAGWYIVRVGVERLMCYALLLAGIGTLGFLFSQSQPLWLQLLSLVLLGCGIGSAMTAASSAIMLSAPADRAGMAASIEEVSYELGGALGVAILGSLMTLLYSQRLLLPARTELPAQVRDSLDEALIVAEGLPAASAEPLVEAARFAFDQAFQGVFAVGGVLLIGTAAVIALNLARRPAQP